MSVSMWSYRPEVCDGGGCPGDCDLCDKPKNMEDEDDTSRYIDADKLKKSLSIPSASIIEIGNAITAQIDAQPTADVRENVHGFWLNEEQKDGYIAKRCSNCFEVSGLCLSDKWFDFCPHCGADMRGANDD